MPRIHKLPELLISKIAAGEVIERPFSVVKELVENSIDAGAKNIQVEVEEGGRKSIVIMDDGIGMSREEVLLAIERHATSKISSEEDLFKIQTLGFRGEALPSIAAISYMTLETKAGEDVGTLVNIEGGKITKTGVSALSKGTRMTVQNLFFNTPARLKFLKSKETEFSHIAGWIESIALSRPEIGFSLRHQGRMELRSDPRASLRERISDILGAEIAELMRPISMSRSRMELTGFISDHQVTGTSAKSLFFYVNGRPVRDKTLQHAVLSAYENLLMKHRYPWVVLHLSIPPDLVDVNVHPTKSEVRFAQGSLVHELVREGVRRVLGSCHFESVLPRFDGSETLPRATQAPMVKGVGEKAEDLFDAANRNHFLPKGAGEGALRPMAFETIPLAISSLRIIGQAHATYLICETPDKLILIDQHAAHERIGFEKLKKQYEEGGVARQQLLIPQNFDLRPSQGEILKKYLDDLSRVGLEVEFFGGNTFIIRSIPVLLEGSDLVSLIEELIDSLQSFEKLNPLEERIHEVLERMACHSQVRAGDQLSSLEIEALLKEMQTTHFHGQCPHGRPSILEIPFNEIEKWFKRRL